MKILNFLIFAFLLASCGDSNEDPCNFSRTIEFNIVCSNCSESDRLNVQINGNANGESFSGSAVISSDTNFDVPISVRNPNFEYNIVTTQVGNPSTTLTQASGSDNFGESCQKSVDIQVSY